MSELSELIGTHGTLLARVDDTDYLAVRAVYAVRGDDPPTPYCRESEWDAMPMARMAELLGVNDRLSARVVELEAKLAALVAPDVPALNQAGMFRAQAAYISGAATREPAGDLSCPECGKCDWKSARALQMHRQRAHQGMVAGRAPSAQFVEALGWRCAAKGCAGAHAQSLSDPAFCTLHAAPHTNGHALEVAS